MKNSRPRQLAAPRAQRRAQGLSPTARKLTTHPQRFPETGLYTSLKHSAKIRAPANPIRSAVLKFPWQDRPSELILRGGWERPAGVGAGRGAGCASPSLAKLAVRFGDRPGALAGPSRTQPTAAVAQAWPGRSPPSLALAPHHPHSPPPRCLHPGRAWQGVVRRLSPAASTLPLLLGSGPG